MTESKSHKTAKRKAAGRSGKTEVRLPGGRRLDAATKKTATEVELSGNFDAAARRLKASGKPNKVMVVPEKDRPAGRAAMRRAGTGGTVRNISGSKKSSVPKPK